MPTATPTSAPGTAERDPEAISGTSAMLISALVIPGRPEHVQAARAFTGLVLGVHARDDGGISSLLVSELVTNSVQHSDSGKLGGTVTITVAVTPAEILIEVIDNGGAGEPAPRETSDAGNAEDGRGLYLVKELSSAWGHFAADGRLTTWFELKTGQPS